MELRRKHIETLQTKKKVHTRNSVGTMGLKSFVPWFALVPAILTFLYIVSDFQPYQWNILHKTKLPGIDHFQEHLFKDNLNFSDVSKSAGISLCSDNVNIYLQFILEDQRNTDLTNNLNNLIFSIMRHTNCMVHFYILSNELGREVVEFMVKVFKARYSWFNIGTIYYLDYYKTAKEATYYTKPMKELFAMHTTNYYINSWFHITPGLHRILLPPVERIIALDIDMLVLHDIKYLWHYFKKFTGNQMMAFSSEQQPVYLHVTSLFREKNDGTVVGKPLPHGLPGVNAGVKLLHLQRLRHNQVYNSFLDQPIKLVRLAEKFHLQGHLGDQDFFTLLSFEFAKWIYILPCGWNRQLCQWWRLYGGYGDVFHMYNKCSTPHSILHGNCNTEIDHQDFHQFVRKVAQ